MKFTAKRWTEVWNDQFKKTVTAATVQLSGDLNYVGLKNYEVEIDGQTCLILGVRKICDLLMPEKELRDNIVEFIVDIQPSAA